MRRRRLGDRQQVRLGLAALLFVGTGCGIGLAVAGGGGEYVPQFGITVPAEKLALVKRAVPKNGPDESTVKAPVPTGRISPMPAGIFEGGPPAVPPMLVRVVNGWAVSDGRHLVVVYAGEAGDDSANGRFAIIRQDLVKGTQTENYVTVVGSGAVRITAGPEGAAVESTAQRAQLQYRAASGVRGVFDLATGTAR